MRKGWAFCLLLLLILTANLISEKNSYASTGANTGITGLWEYPSAEMPDDGIGRFGYTKASPYGYYFFDMAWLPWLEVGTRLETFSTIDASGRRYMDKAMDLKFRLWHNKDRSKWYVPSVAAGVVDMMGTELMKAWFAAFTWRSGRFAATLGYGTDRLNGIYGGIEWDAEDWLSFKAEYSPLDYNHDVVGRQRVIRNDSDMPSKKYNVGVVLKAPWGTDASVSYQRGNEWVVGVSQKINLSGPFFGTARKHYGTPGDKRSATWEDVASQDLVAQIKSGIEKFVRVRDVDVEIYNKNNSHKLKIAYENYGYSSQAEAMTRMLVLLSAVMPELDELTLIHKNAGVPIVKATFPGSLLFDIRAKSLRNKEPINTALFGWVESEDIIRNPDAKNLLKKKAEHEVKAMVVWEPRIDQTLREEFMDRFSIDAIYRGRYSGGWGADLAIRFPFLYNADITDNTGLWWEKDFNEEERIQRAGLTYANKIGGNSRTWFFADAGYLDEEWFGANAYARYYDKSGRFWIGARVTSLHNRDPYSFGGLSKGILQYKDGKVLEVPADNEWYMGGWLQAGYHFADLDLDFDASYGQFLDKDKGYKLQATRHWDDTAIGFWIIEAERKIRSYSRAGIHLEVPAEKWFGAWLNGQSSSHVWEANPVVLSAWYMHSAREGATLRTPEKLMNQLRPVALKKNVEKLLQEYCSYEEPEVTPEATSAAEYFFPSLRK